MQEQGHPEPVGRVKVTPGFNLPALAHGWALMHRNQHQPIAMQKTQMAKCYTACLDAVEALPALPDWRKVYLYGSFCIYVS